jgi:hypothetical protein
LGPGLLQLKEKNDVTYSMDKRREKNKKRKNKICTDKEKERMGETEKKKQEGK